MSAYPPRGSARRRNSFFPVQDLNTSNPARFRVRVEETTLFNPLWSTNAVETRYRLFNTTNRPCRVTLDLRTDGNGIPSGGSNTVTFFLAENTSVTRNTGAGDLNLQNGQLGHATLAHDCMPGAILVDAFLASPSREVPVTFTTARQQRWRAAGPLRVSGGGLAGKLRLTWSPRRPSGRSAEMATGPRLARARLKIRR